MSTRTPDRFERIARKNLQLDGEVPSEALCMFSVEEIARLFRAEHRWMVKMVKRVDAWSCEQLADNDDVIAEILKQLEKRAR